MDIQEEIDYSERLIAEARKVNPQIGYFVKLTSKPFSGDVTVMLTNGSAKIGRLVLFEFRRSGKNTPKKFIEEVAWSFEAKQKSES